ncbi:FtsX-like permease family protein [Actinomyces sp.]|uniref:FtsX-like permease family protein n=1 Tax=Actinomyces sp. TaxID=29317 RepID=UPI0026DC50E7|nr:ABC transporter permease [Actinomyces sp.]MDO4901763.1 ABC transporter permease [Actinomyces sp.]
MHPGPSLRAALAVAAGVSTLAGVLAIDAALPAAGTASGAGPAHDYVHGLLLGLAALVTLAVMVIVMNAFATSLRRRTHVLALLRATGATATPVVLVVLLQATAIGLLGCALGMLGGIGVLHLLDVVVASSNTPLEGLEAAATAPTPAAIAVGLPATLIGALPPAIGAARTPPAGAASNETPRSSAARGVVGAVAGPLGIVGICVAWRMDGLAHRLPVLGTSAALLLIGLLIALPAVLRPLVLLLGLPVRPTPSGFLAVRHLAATPRHGAALAAAPLLGAAATCLTIPTAAGLRASQATTAAQETVLDALPILLAAVSLLAGFCTAGALAASTSQRSAETALLQAVGRSRAQAVGQFLCEVLLAGAGGVILGGASGLLMSVALNAVLLDHTQFGTIVPDMGLLVPASVGCVGGALAALVPALRATRPSADPNIDAE